jgi:diamine N-acetyltransferase
VIITLKNNQSILLRRLTINDLNELCRYLQALGPETKNRFGPHQFDEKSITEFYARADVYTGYVAIDRVTATIIAYAIIKPGYLEHDKARLQSYGLTVYDKTDCTFAPSVADSWQGLGIGNNLFQFILRDLKTTSINRIILWGGVQAGNDKALHYYAKNGFKILGQFNYNGDNYDMVLNIT